MIFFLPSPYGLRSQKKSSYLINISNFIKSLVLASLSLSQKVWLSKVVVFFALQNVLKQIDNGKTKLHKQAVNLITD